MRTKKHVVEKNKKQETGITLLALVITIVILLILAGITISAITGNNGIIENARQAKEETEIANEKEIVEKAIAQAMGKNKYGKIEESKLQSELDKETGEGKTVATDIGDELEVVFNASNRYYMVDKDGNVGEAQDIIEDKNPGDITVGKDGEILDGSEEHPYEIWCIEDLVTFSNMVNGSGIKLENGEVVKIETTNSFKGKYIVLKTNLNFKSKLSYQNSERTDFGDINGDTDDGNTLINEMTTGTGFKPIGISNRFEGSFDGENKKIGESYKISNLYINYENDTVLNGYGFGRSVGLFGNGNFQYTIIKNLEISGEIKGAGHTGGIIGQNAKLIENCTNYADVSGYNMVGGIIGGSINEIENCENNGKINIAGTIWAYGGAGGIVGCASETNIIKNCCNTGNVLGNNTRRGGIVGVIYTSSRTSILIDSCTNMGKASSGICDLLRIGNLKIVNSRNLEECENSGIIREIQAGNYDIDIECNIKNSYNLGKTQNAGIVATIGYVSKSVKLNIENVYNSGECTSAIIGTISQKGITTLNISNVYYNKEISQKVGAIEEGIQAYSESEIKNNSNFINILNNNIQNNIEWKKWKIGEDGYPTFE